MPSSRPQIHNLLSVATRAFAPLLILLSTFAFPKASSATPPNVILILADDLGYGDLSCYGQQKFATPNIDRLAAQGLRFTAHYAGSTVCAPSRCSLLTGMHTGHTTIRGNQEVQPIGQAPIKDSDFTIAELLGAAGYRTGAIGKWGLGYPGSEGDPNRQGFDYFFGYNCQRNAHDHYPPFLWRNNERVDYPGNHRHSGVAHSHDLFTAEALEFIRRNKNEQFFLYLPYCVPHASLTATEDVLKEYRGQFEEISFTAPVSGYRSTDEPRANFAAMISMLDRDVGRLLQELKDLKLDDQTLILFTSDNGPHREGGATPEFFNSSGGLRGVKRDLYEGGIRVPMIARWPGKIEPGRSTDLVSAFWDVLPTLAELVDVPLPSKTDGISFLPTLFGHATQTTHDYLYWEFPEQGGKRAVRSGDWKAIQLETNAHPDRPLELYNLKEDPGELHDVAESHPDIVASMARTMRTARSDPEN